MIYSAEVEHMTCVAKGPNHGAAPIPQEGRWVQAKEIKDISGLTHGIGWCAPQQGACKLTLNVKDGVIQEALDQDIDRVIPRPTNLKSTGSYIHACNADRHICRGTPDDSSNRLTVVPESCDFPAALSPSMKEIHE